MQKQAEEKEGCRRRGVTVAKLAPDELRVYVDPMGRVTFGATTQRAQVALGAFITGKWSDDPDGKPVFHVPGLRVKKPAVSLVTIRDYRRVRGLVFHSDLLSLLNPDSDHDPITKEAAHVVVSLFASLSSLSGAALDVEKAPKARRAALKRLQNAKAAVRPHGRQPSIVSMDIARDLPVLEGMWKTFTSLMKHCNDEEPDGNAATEAAETISRALDGEDEAISTITLIAPWCLGTGFLGEEDVKNLAEHLKGIERPTRARKKFMAMVLAVRYRVSYGKALRALADAAGTGGRPRAAAQASAHDADAEEVSVQDDHS